MTLLLSVIPGAAQSPVFVGAPGFAFEGNSSTFEPFGRMHQVDPDSARYQQVYSASEFAEFFLTGATISEIRFRADGDITRGFGTGFRVQVNMSVTPRGPDELSINFNENVGFAEQVVYPENGLTLGGGPGDTEGLRIQFPTSYIYDPAAGNLLLDIRVLGFSTHNDPALSMGALDAHNNSADTISRVYSHDVNAASGIADTIGLTTFFVVTPVPEPSVTAMLALGIALGLASVWRRKQRRSR